MSDDNEEEMNTNICSICIDPMDSHSHMLRCGHLFHAPCIIEWFRCGEGTCPLCRDPASARMSYRDVMARCSFLRKKAKKQKCSQRSSPVG